MISKSLALSLILLSVLASVALAIKNANADEPLCYMRTTDARTIDLTMMCAQKPKTVLSSNDKQAAYSSQDSTNPDQAVDAALRQLNAQNRFYGDPASNFDLLSTQGIGQ